MPADRILSMIILPTFSSPQVELVSLVPSRILRSSPGSGYRNKSLLMAIGWVPLIIVICYFFVLQKPATFQTHSEAKAEEGTGVPTLSEAPGAPAALSDAPEPAAGAVPAKLSFVQRLRQMKHLAKFLIPLLLVYFSEYLINQGISPTIKFDGPIPRDDYYRYYATIYQVGVFFSRSSTSLFTIKHVWVPSVLQVWPRPCPLPTALCLFAIKHYPGYQMSCFTVPKINTTPFTRLVFFLPST
ncbi:putative CLN3 protein [Paratrimastix pyriformis]|uniref:CLN3 protein n=1 Tax=Paratrimastix pyriformis TaxID=342808 RepID=A0ABQ8U950_9EUKA|nr:putative CLN3 protein [Paratrimastix pyriformis]